MTTLAYRKRKDEIDAFYDRASGWIVAAGCITVILALAALMNKVLL